MTKENLLKAIEFFKKKGLAEKLKKAQNTLDKQYGEAKKAKPGA